jgi:hypothetical protein
VNLYDGGINSDFLIPTTGIGAMSWVPPYLGGPTHFSINAIDGQLPIPGFPDDFFINGALASGIPGTFVPGNAWVGLVGPAAPSAAVQYDIVNADIAGMFGVVPGVGGLTFNSAGPLALGWDCLGHTFGGFSYPVIPEPSTLLLSLVAAAGLRFRRR